MRKLQYFGYLMWKNSLEKPWCWERVRAWEAGVTQNWDGWMASLTQRTWVWANSRKQWRTEKPGVLQSMESQRVGHNLATEQHFSSVPSLRHAGMTSTPDKTTGNWRKGWTGWTYCIIKQQRSVNMVFNTNGK